MNLTKILTLAALVGTALMGGLFFAFGTAVMSALQRMPAGQGATAMNLINVRIQNPLFLLIFMGTALVCVALGIVALVKDSPGKWWLVAGAALYLIGVIVLSFAVNIPLNDQLAAIDPNSTAGAAEWTKYLANWNPANNVRALACALGVIAFGLALASGAGSTTRSAPAPQTQVQHPNHGQHPTQGQPFAQMQLPNPGWQTPPQAGPRPQSWQ
jgi:uncharacterized membrane protein